MKLISFFKKNKIIKNRFTYIKKAKDAKISIKGFLNLCGNSFGNNGRSSILRMDNNSTLECENFTFMYGADIILFENAKLKLGKNSFINSDCKIRCHKDISIGENCAISHDFTIMDSDGHYINGIKKTAPVVIGNNVWIGTRVTILKGVTIGDGAVIASGSVVINDIPGKCMAGGVPAKVIKEKVEWKL